MIKKRLKYLLTKRGLSSLFEHTLIGIGTLWLIIESSCYFIKPLQTFCESNSYVLAIILGISIPYGGSKTLPKLNIGRMFKSAKTEITIKVGNLLDENCHIVIPSSDYFDANATSLSNSIKTQVIQKFYNSNDALFSQEISASLMQRGILGVYNPNKPSGKQHRFEPGTTAILHNNNKMLFITVFPRVSYINGAKHTETNNKDLLNGLDGLWTAVRTNGHMQEISVPIIGAGLSRSPLSHLMLIQTILLSFAMNSKPHQISQKLNIVIHKKYYNPSDMIELQRFLNSLEL